jgi:hypothetical protein
MVSTTTIYREKKKSILKEVLNNIIDLLLMEHKQRDSINLARFKRLSHEVKSMLEEARIVKSKSENFTRKSKKK